MHINRRHTGGNLRGQIPAKANIIHNTRLAVQKDDVIQNMKHDCIISHELAMINDIVTKDKRVTITFLLQRQILRQLHINHMGIKKRREGVSVLDEFECKH